MSVERAARNAGWYFGANLVRRVIHLAYPLYIARKLGKVTWGNYYFLITLVGLLTLLAGMGLGVYIVRRVNRDPGGARRLVGNCLGLKLVASAFLTIAFLLTACMLDVKSQLKLGMVLISLCVLPNCMRALFVSVATAYEMLWLYALVDNLGGVLEAIVGITLVAMGFRLASLCLLHTVMTVLVMAALWLLLRRYDLPTRVRFYPREWPGYLKGSWKVWALSGNRALYNNLGPILLRGISGAEKVGYFGLAMTAYQLIKVAAEGFVSAVFPFMVRAWYRSADELKAFHQSTLRLLLTIGVPAGFVGLLLAGPVIGYLFPGGRYADSVPVMKILAWFVYLHFYETIAVRTCHASGRLLLPVVGHTLANTVSIVLSLVFITQMTDEPHVGLAWARLLSVGFSFVVYTVLIRRYVYDLNPLTSLGRAIAASVVPTLLVVLLDGRMHVAILTPVVLATFAVGAWGFRLLTRRELDILKRALHLSKPPTPEETLPPSDVNGAP